MTHLRLAALLATATLLAAGCSDDDPEPRVEPTPSASPTESPTSSPSTTAVTPSAEPRTAEATVKAWIKAQNLALKTGDTSELETLSAPSCRTCQEFIDPVKDIYSAGGRFETKGWDVSSVRLRDPSATPLEVDAAVTIRGGSTYPDATSAPVVYQEDKTIMRFRLLEQGGLVVSFIGFLS